ncbi:mechanosensitive ion channel family protein [Kitasatospora sp. NBC_01287]|uniref:mechanosensitive ion channel family protein n=1 Tax=Kitasatospora sp. NBC_01287 TaxID=2903573 RepID=UPI002259A48A|nr:mechanosensitive ion channel domain-containing protein [Kitasatospora sp. NBC_01287]MCX4751661.1 mechanosensitive ion channel family protein [Kitasatospora sp. NBC_01287]
MSLWSLLRPLALAGGVALATAALDRAVLLLARHLPGRRPGQQLRRLLRGCRVPTLATLASMLLLAAEPGAGLPGAARGPIRHALLLAAMAAGAWLLARLLALLIDTSLARYATDRRDPARIRRVRTQTGMLRRLSAAAIAVVALASALMTFPAVRSVGASLLASAGLVTLVVGVAAQSTLANLFAGIQLAFGDMVRLGDNVVVAGDWGVVEEVTLTSVVIATWDQRRIVMPVSYFVGKPFENWSRSDPAITGTALLHLDHRAPLDELRAEFDRLLKECQWWDGVGSALQLVDTTPSTIVVRALMTARNAADAFELRCWIRERLIAYLREHAPEALPRIDLTYRGSAVGD